MSEPRFLLVRLDGLGDALACVPALEGLRRAHCAASFGIVCSEANAHAFSSLAGTIHVFRAAADLPALEHELRVHAYTHALVATEETIGYQLARSSGAPRRAGFWHGLDKPFKSLWQFAQLTDRVHRPAAWTARPEHEVATLYRLAEPYGAAPPPPDDAHSLREWLAIDPMPEPRSRSALGFQITAKLATGGWGPAALAALCESTLRSSGLSTITLLAASNDQGLARSLLEQMSASTRARSRLLPAGDVPHWFGAIDSLAAIVTPDTGAAHAAGILGVPVIDLFDERRFAQLSQQWRPWAAPRRCVVKPAFTIDAPDSFGAEIGAALVPLLGQDART